jgi:DNA polymerase-1
MNAPVLNRIKTVAKLLLVDGHNMLHRVCFIPELQKLSSSQGIPTGPVYGFLRVLRATLERFSPESCIICWDTPSSGVGRRNALYPAYKANRADKEKPEALQHFSEQLQMLRNILPYLNVKQFGAAGYEGDDLLYLLTKRFYSEDATNVVVVTDDKDMLQLVRDGATVYRPIADQVITYENFEEMTGVHPEAFVLRKAIVGDVSDNVKGVFGVGEKTADKLLRAAFKNELDAWVVDGIMMDEDYDPLISLCSGHKTKTAKKVTEQWGVVERNLKLMDLRKNTFHETVHDAADNLVDSVSAHFSDVELISILGKYEFSEITKRFATWITPFRKLR